MLLCAIRILLLLLYWYVASLPLAITLIEALFRHAARRLLMPDTRARASKHISRNAAVFNEMPVLSNFEILLYIYQPILASSFSRVILHYAYYKLLPYFRRASNGHYFAAAELPHYTPPMLHATATAAVRWPRRWVLLPHMVSNTEDTAGIFYRIITVYIIIIDVYFQSRLYPRHACIFHFTSASRRATLIGEAWFFRHYREADIVEKDY